MAVPEVKGEQPSVIPQKRSGSAPDSAPVFKKPDITTTRKESYKKDDFSDPKCSKLAENLTEGEVLRRLEAVRTEMATISWYMDLPEKLRIPETLLGFRIPNMPKWPDQGTIDKWLAQRHRQPENKNKDTKDEGPCNEEDKKYEEKEEVKGEKVEGKKATVDSEYSMQQGE